LGRTRKGFAATALADALAGDASWQVRQQAARSLQDLSSARVAAALVGALLDPEPSVRAAAGSALSETDVPSLQNALADALADEKDPSVRAVLRAAVRRAPRRP
ncbi:MAG: HEAT repeat domain-containing protein, partial [Elusimicrobiota bacterium]